MPPSEELRAKIIENAAELNRLHSRIHETFKRRDKSPKLREAWSHACAEFHDRYGELWIPGGSDPRFFERVVQGDPVAVEAALCFLEVRPYFFRSGYHWKTILRKCKRAPMSAEQAERFANLLQRYSEWRACRNLSSGRGEIVRRDLSPLVRHFYGLLPVTLPNFAFDGVVTVGDLYRILCNALKIEPLSQPMAMDGVVREACACFAKMPSDMSGWAREYGAWREAPWSPGDVWATLVAKIIEVYQPEESLAITPETVLRSPTEP
jgi:hypothetical protein